MEAGAAAGLGIEFEAAAGELDAFREAGEAEGIAAGEGGRGIEAAAAVGDLDVEGGGIGDDGDLRGAGTGVAGDVGEGFLHDAVGGEFERSGETRGGEGELEVECKASLATHGGEVGLEGGAKAEVVEQARAELEREGADGREEFIGDADGFAEGGAGGGGAGSLELKAEAGEELTDLIVQLVGEGVALVFLHAEEAGGEGVGVGDLGSELGGACGDLGGERAVEGGEFVVEFGREAGGGGVFQRARERENEVGVAAGAGEEEIVRAEFEGGDGSLGSGGPGEEEDGERGVMRAEVAQRIEEGRGREVGAEDDGGERGLGAEGGFESRGSDGGEAQAGSVRGKETGGGGAFLAVGIDEEHALRGGSGGGREELGAAAMACDGVVHDLGDAGKIGRVFIDAIGRAGAEGAHGELGLALAADHDDGRGIAAGGEFGEDGEAVAIREAEVEEEGVKGVRGERGEARLSGGDDGELAVRRREKVEPDDVGDRRIVFGVEHADHDKWMLGSSAREGLSRR